MISKQEAIQRIKSLKDEHEQTAKAGYNTVAELDMQMKRVAAETADRLARLAGQVDLLMEMFDLVDADLESQPEAEKPCTGDCGSCACDKVEAYVPELAVS